jgi:Ca-activated chloride channel family protein
VQQEGYDIVLAIDLSGSMLAEDYKRMGKRINRIQAIVPIIEAFMERRSNDRIGVVAFGGRAYTLAPLSFDHGWLRTQVSRLRVGLVEDGTAIGDALALAVSRLGQVDREQAGKRLGGFIILLTDGANNAGSILPAKAAELAAAKGIPVYTIGAGQEGLVPMPVYNDQGQLMGYRNVMSDLDEATLQAIAQATNGSYYRAMDADTIDEAFAAIDQSNKIEFEAKSNLTAHELYPFMAWPGLACTALAYALARPGAKEGDA